jgi:hypothetical protein
MILMKTTILFFVLSFGISQVKASEGPTSREKSPAVRNILSTQLPAKLRTSVKKNYKDYWITDCRKANLNGKVSYYITLENADQTVKMNTTHSTGWTIARVIPKEESVH